MPPLRHATLRDVFLSGSRKAYAIKAECRRQPFGFDANRKWYVRPEAPVECIEAATKDSPYQVIFLRDFDQSGQLPTFTYFVGERARDRLEILATELEQVTPWFGWYGLSSRLTCIQDVYDRVQPFQPGLVVR